MHEYNMHCHYRLIKQRSESRYNAMMRHMTWLLLIALHMRATWPGLAYTRFSDFRGWAAGQVFFLGVAVLLALLARSSRWAARLVQLPAAALAIALVLAGWSARRTGDTFHIFTTETGKTRWEMLRSSAAAEADRFLILDALLAIAAIAASFRLKPAVTPHRAVIATSAVALAVLGALPQPKDARLESPLLALIKSHGATLRPSSMESIADLRTLRYGTVAIPANTLIDLRKTRDALLEKGRHPNIVLVFLESTGYRQIQPGGTWDPALTPSLYALSRNGVLFTTVYAPFPGTVRSHLSIMTGGKIITWGSVYKELAHRYLGPTLPGELKNRGYRTGFFSAAFLDSENMDGFYDLLPFDEKLIPERMPKAYQDAHAFNSWGIDDREAADRAVAWAKKGNEPFFAAINLDATHHPYDVPDGFPLIQPGDQNEEHFANALHFTDSVLGGLVHGLIEAGLDDTLVMIIGDHGESFGELHPGNFTHRNFIYEENVRSFLMIADLKKRIAPLTVEFPASHGDVLSTTLDMVDVEGTSGSLFEPKDRIEYFYKNTYPELWGLRDGEWKFIESVLPGQDEELYRLDRDPHESHNLAPQYPARMLEYRKLVTQWYLDSQNEFVARLEDYHFEGGEALKAEDLVEPGPKRLTFGTVAKDDSFTPTETVSLKSKIGVFTKDVPYQDGKALLYRWQAPDGSEQSFTFLHEADWSDVYVYPQSSIKMTPGLWKVGIFDGTRELIHGQVLVTP
jgi:arylsulfatase A-like enzyme